MTASTFAIFDSTTGAIRGVLIGSSRLLTSNVGGSENYKDVGGSLPDPDAKYIADPGGAKTLTTRPDFTSSIPETVAEGFDLAITDVPNGATVVITSTGAGGGTHTKSGGPGTLDAAVTGAADGDILSIQITLWPYRPLLGECSVVSA